MLLRKAASEALGTALLGLTMQFGCEEGASGWQLIATGLLYPLCETSDPLKVPVCPGKTGPTVLLGMLML